MKVRLFLLGLVAAFLGSLVACSDNVPELPKKDSDPSMKEKRLPPDKK